jgi:hypothetical protein
MAMDEDGGNLVDLVQRLRRDAAPSPPRPRSPRWVADIPPAEALQLVKLYTMIESPADRAELLLMAAKLARQR